jgi:diguanylate cyclase (GGDEF)-like protein
MRTLRDLNLNKLTVSKNASVFQALVAMQKSSQAAAAVLDDQNNLIGIATIEACILSDSELPIKEVMRGASTHLDRSDPVRSAAKSFVRQQADFVAVFDKKKFVGLLSSLMLITELGRSWDPLTGLSWSDRLRDWGVECLEAGQEISIVFFDLNDFGNYNKKYGHTVGDSVIRGFGAYLSESLDPSRDVLVRYGGDEFALGTTRDRAETLELLKSFEDRTFSVKNIDAPVGFSYGISGGKRTQEPSRDHVAATLDNLINLASKDCLANKPKDDQLTKQESDAHAPDQPKQLELNVILAESADNDGRFLVHVADGGQSYRGESTDLTSRYRGVANAALSALRKFDSEIHLTIADIAFTYINEHRYVEIWGEKVAGSEITPYHVQHQLNGNIDSSIAKAVVKAYSQAILTE